MTPALDTSIVDLKLRADLPATSADTPPAPQPDAHDHPPAAEADVSDRCPGKPEQPLNAVVVRTSSSCRALPSTASSLPRETAARLHNLRNIPDGG
jgi:hypothetical protein